MKAARAYSQLFIPFHGLSTQICDSEKQKVQVGWENLQLLYLSNLSLFVAKGVGQDPGPAGLGFLESKGDSSPGFLCPWKLAPHGCQWNPALSCPFDSALIL